MYPEHGNELAQEHLHTGQAGHLSVVWTRLLGIGATWLITRSASRSKQMALGVSLLLQKCSPNEMKPQAVIENNQ